MRNENESDNSLHIELEIKNNAAQDNIEIVNQLNVCEGKLRYSEGLQLQNLTLEKNGIMIFPFI